MSAEEQAVPVPIEDTSSRNTLPRDGAQWVELLVSEMGGASTIDEARNCATKVLEVLEKSIRDQASAEAAGNYQKVI